MNLNPDTEDGRWNADVVVQKAIDVIVFAYLTPEEVINAAKRMGHSLTRLEAKALVKRIHTDITRRSSHPYEKMIVTRG